MDTLNLNDYFFAVLKKYIENEKCWIPEVTDNLYLKHFAEKNKTDILKYIIKPEHLQIIEDNTFEAMEECNLRINLKTYHDCEIVAIAHGATSQTIKHIKHYTDNTMFLTIRPAEDMRQEDFEKLIDRLLLKDIITSYIVVFEQKGDSYSTLGQGKHIHALLKFNYNMEMKHHRQKIKEFCKKNNVMFDIGKTALKREFIPDKLYYMGLIYNDDKEVLLNENLKYKKTEDKIKCLEYDRIYQKKYNLNVKLKNEYQFINLIPDPPN